MSLFDQINKEKVPAHVAIIMDGNGRWAKQKNMERVMGHGEGLNAVRRAIEAASMLNIRYLTLYTFSTENWKRPAEEVKALMALMIKAVADETEELIKNNIRVATIGDTERLPEATREALADCLQRTSKSTGTTVILALSYSSKWELTEATKQIAADVQNGKISISDITEDLISSYLSTKNIPDPDLLIRTGGELRISNFLLWQIAYSELYFTDCLWPDFNAETLNEAVLKFQERERRYGKISEQVQESK